jgi:hypothetical protein
LDLSLQKSQELEIIKVNFLRQKSVKYQSNNSDFFSVKNMRLALAKMLLGVIQQLRGPNFDQF